MAAGCEPLTQAKDTFLKPLGFEYGDLLSENPAQCPLSQQ